MADTTSTTTAAPSNIWQLFGAGLQDQAPAAGGIFGDDPNGQGLQNPRNFNALLAAVAGAGQGMLQASVPTRMPMGQGYSGGMMAQGALAGMSGAYQAAQAQQYAQAQIAQKQAEAQNTGMDMYQKATQAAMAYKMAGLPVPPQIAAILQGAVRMPGMPQMAAPGAAGAPGAASAPQGAPAAAGAPGAAPQATGGVPVVAAPPGSATAVGAGIDSTARAGYDPADVMAVLQGKKETTDPALVRQAIIMAGMAGTAGQANVAALQSRYAKLLENQSNGMVYDPQQGVFKMSQDKIDDTEKSKSAETRGSQLLTTNAQGVTVPQPGSTQAMNQQALGKAAGEHLMTMTPGGGVAAAPGAAGATRSLAFAQGAGAEAGRVSASPAMPRIDMVSPDGSQRLSLDPVADKAKLAQLSGQGWTTTSNISAPVNFTNEDNKTRFTESGNKITELTSASNNLAQREAIINSGLLNPGAIQDHLQEARSLVASLGLASPEDAAKLDANRVYQSLATGATFSQKSLEGISRLTNFDVSLFQKQVPDLSTNPNALRTMTALERTATNYELAHQNFIRNSLMQGGNATDAEAEWRKNNPSPLTENDKIGVKNMLDPTGKNVRVPMFKSAAELDQWANTYGWSLKNRPDLQRGFIDQQKRLAAKESQ